MYLRVAVAAVRVDNVVVTEDVGGLVVASHAAHSRLGWWWPSRSRNWARSQAGLAAETSELGGGDGQYGGEDKLEKTIVSYRSRETIQSHQKTMQ